MKKFIAYIVFKWLLPYCYNEWTDLCDKATYKEMKERGEETYSH